MSSAVAAKAAAKVSSPPSSFSSLLRKSKFASYDPKIGQVYATYGGSVQRGDWGLKRPLAIRRSDSCITVGSLDTIYQQTEWENASTDAMAVRKFEELKLTPKVAPKGTWAPRLGHSLSPRIYNYMHDADYVNVPKGKRDALLKMTQPLPDTSAMSERRFERYIQRVRRLGVDFEPYAQALEEERLRKREEGAEGGLEKQEGGYPYQLKARRELSDHAHFLADKLAEVYDAKNSTAIRPFPHPNAGLSYVHAAELQTALSSGPVPGRALHSCDLGGRRQSSNMKDVAVAGWVGVAQHKPGELPEMTDFGKDDAPRASKDSGKGLYKPLDVEIVHAPNVVGKQPERINVQRWVMQLIDWNDESAGIPLNLHQPGSAEYITYKSRPSMRASTRSPRSGAAAKYRRSSKWVGRASRDDQVTKAQASGLLEGIRSMIPGNTKDSDVDL